MKHSILFALAIAAVPLAQAAPLEPQRVANMKAQARQVMDAGACAVANDTQDYGTATKAIRLRDGSFRRVLTNTYNRIRATGYERSPLTGEWRMVEQIGACSVDAESDACLTARSLWSDQPPEVRPPGAGVKLR